MGILRRYGPALVLTLTPVAACDFVPDPVALDALPGRVAVHSLLVGGADTAKVLVVRAGGASQASGAPFAPVSDAGVVLTGPDGEIELHEDLAGAPRCGPRQGPQIDSIPSAGPGCYTAFVPGGLRAGAAYRLRIDLPDGERIEGEARPLGPPAIETPAEGARFVMDSVELDGRRTVAPITVRWTTSARTALLSVGMFEADRIFRAGAAVPDASCSLTTSVPDSDARVGFNAFDVDAEADSAVLIVHQSFCSFPDDSIAGGPVEAWDSIHARLWVAAYDSSYSDYYRTVIAEGGPVDVVDAAVGVEGATGVFAGGGRTERRVTLVAPERTDGDSP